MLKAIETCWKGYRFRSRLEARWAVFFDSLGLDWDYETEGFETDAGRYLPDFKVQSMGMTTFYEVKPTGGTSAKLDAFAKAIVEEFDMSAVLLVGDPMSAAANDKTCLRCGVAGSSVDPTPWGPDEIGIYCEPCDFNTPCGGDHPKEKGALGVECRPHKGNLIFSTEDYAEASVKVLKAAKRARAARFEHGEAPR